MSKKHYYKVGSILITVILTFSSATQSEQESSSSHVANSAALQERHRFESLLAAGRMLSFPYATGLILTAVSSQRENWNVSLQGMDKILDLSPAQLCSTYKDTMELIKQVRELKIGRSNVCGPSVISIKFEKQLILHFIVIGFCMLQHTFNQT